MYALLELFPCQGLAVCSAKYDRLWRISNHTFQAVIGMYYASAKRTAFVWQMHNWLHVLFARHHVRMPQLRTQIKLSQSWFEFYYYPTERINDYLFYISNYQIF